MLISVVIPVFNVVPQLLERSLGSVICHNDEDVEVVVIDDGSEYEKSLQYEAICNAVDNVRYFRKENAGPSSSRNTGSREQMESTSSSLMLMTILLIRV